MESINIQNFFFEVLSKIDAYWNLLIITLIAFSGWLVSTKRTFSKNLKAVLIIGYVLFSVVNAYSLYAAQRIAQSAKEELTNQLMHNHESLALSLKLSVNYDHLNIVLILVHVVLAPFLIYAIVNHHGTEV